MHEMDRVEFLTHRLAFTGVPFGELRSAVQRMEGGAPWGRCLGETARAMRRLACARRARGSSSSATEAWLWAASAYQGASLQIHLDAEPVAGLRRLERFRALARTCYLRALSINPQLARAVRVPWDEGELHGYLRVPPSEPHLVVVLFNGLDSICEAEMHAFGNWMVRRGFGVLALDLPAGLAARPRHPILEVERVAPAIADWIARELGALPLAAFGVSFGGHLVARALSGERRFRAGVAVSSGAWFDRALLETPRIQAMLRFAFAASDKEKLNTVAESANIERLRPPGGRMLVLNMEHDALFGKEHAAALRRWGGRGVEIRSLAAEHVGTSRIHVWLPEACDWIEENLMADLKEEPNVS